MLKVRLILKEDNIEYDKVTTARDIVDFLNKIEQISLLPQETVFLLCLNNKNQVVSYSEIAKGGINYCNMDLKIIFETVLLANANKFILVHNHPSGDPSPSRQDIEITELLQKACEIMQIELVDSLIIASNGCKSCVYRNEVK